jgi:hypothetical protein
VVDNKAIIKDIAEKSKETRSENINELRIQGKSKQYVNIRFYTNRRVKPKQR